MADSVHPPRFTAWRIGVRGDVENVELLVSAIVRLARMRCNSTTGSWGSEVIPTPGLLIELVCVFAATVCARAVADAQQTSNARNVVETILVRMDPSFVHQHVTAEPTSIRSFSITFTSLT
jgi:hypothetical protein